MGDNRGSWDIPIQVPAGDVAHTLEQVLQYLTWRNVGTYAHLHNGSSTTSEVFAGAGTSTLIQDWVAGETSNISTSAFASSFSSIDTDTTIGAIEILENGKYLVGVNFSAYLSAGTADLDYYVLHNSTSLLTVGIGAPVYHTTNSTPVSFSGPVECSKGDTLKVQIEAAGALTVNYKSMSFWAHRIGA